MQDETPALVADLGGTNARFALADWEGVRDVRVLSVAEHPTLASAIGAYLDQVQPKKPPRQAAIDIAGPVTGDRVGLTNHPWSFSVSELQAQLALDRLLVINDFTAVALAVPHLAPADYRQIGRGAPVPQETIGIIGPGTGLGVSGLIPAARDRWTPLAAEGGHVTMAAATDREAAVLDRLRRRYGHVSAERVLSGMGLVHLYETLAALDGDDDPMAREPAEITAAARSGDAACLAAVQMFSALLGVVAGNLALTLGARGGVYIAGGIVPKLGGLFDDALFRERFEAKGRLRPYVAAMPTFVVTNDLPAFIGLRAVLHQPA